VDEIVIKCADKSVDPEWFFSDDLFYQSFAKQICETCPVAAECLRSALAGNQKYGIWGGMTADERQSLSRKTARMLLANRRKGSVK